MSGDSSDSSERCDSYQAYLDFFKTSPTNYANSRGFQAVKLAVKEAIAEIHEMKANEQWVMKNDGYLLISMAEHWVYHLKSIMKLDPPEPPSFSGWSSDDCYHGE